MAASAVFSSSKTVFFIRSVVGGSISTKSSHAGEHKSNKLTSRQVKLYLVDNVFMGKSELKREMNTKCDCTQSRQRIAIHFLRVNSGFVLRYRKQVLCLHEKSDGLQVNFF